VPACTSHGHDVEMQMGVVKTGLSGIAGVLTGLALGYILWGQSMADLRSAFATVSAELATTKTWLWDEIRSSDERYEKVASALTKAQADLTRAQAELARIQAISRNAGEGGASALVGRIGARRPDERVPIREPNE
jgi:multidrug efflux pump subunit AcrA (membrane-fusion protein)